jgi:hypothetical protein
VARPALPGHEPDGERALHAAVRELRLDEGGHGTVRRETLLLDGGTEVLVLVQNLDGLVELLPGGYRLAAYNRDLQRARDVVETSAGHHRPVVGVVVDRGPVTVRGRRLVRLALDLGIQQPDVEQPVPRPVQVLLDRRVIQDRLRHLVVDLGSWAEGLDVYPHLAVLAHLRSPLYAKTMGTLNRWRSSPDPLALSSEASTTPGAG